MNVDQLRRELLGNSRHRFGKFLDDVTEGAMLVYRVPKVVGGVEWNDERRREAVREKRESVIKLCGKVMDSKHTFENDDVLFVTYPPPPGKASRGQLTLTANQRAQLPLRVH